MKLQVRYNYVNLVATTVIILITGIIYYQAINWILTFQKDKDLIVEEQEILDYVRINHKLPTPFEYNDQQITFTVAAPGSVKRAFINTTYFERWDEGKKHHPRHRGAGGEYESGRGLLSSVTVGTTYYKVLIVESTVETEDLVRLILTITICVLLLLLMTLLVTNRFILRRLWQPFQNIMRELKAFRLAEGGDIPPVSTDIDEFIELNQAVTDMAGRAKTDYKDLKIFTENASHELLTPIAVINSKLDSLIQTENFSERQSALLNDLYTAVSRLNRLNQSLLLLAKIENRLLPDQKEIDVKELIEEIVSLFDEIFTDKEVSVKLELRDKKIYANPYLTEVLVSNLINNAIRHNRRSGEIVIMLNENQLAIKNTSNAPPLDSQRIYTRFHKSPESEGTGLGLTISRQICERFGFGLTYSFDEGYHTFSIQFQPASTPK